MPAQRASEHVRRWEATKGLPAGFLLARSAVEGGAVHLVLDGAPPSITPHPALLAVERWRRRSCCVCSPSSGQITTVEGGSLLYNEILEEGIQPSPDLTPMHLSGQLRFALGRRNIAR